VERPNRIAKCFKQEKLLLEYTHTHTQKEEGGIAKLGNGSSCERRFPQEKIGKCGAR